MSNNLRDYDELMKRGLKITKRYIRDVRSELAVENPPMEIALTLQQTSISVIIMDFIENIEDVIDFDTSDFDERIQFVLGLLERGIKKFREETELKEGGNDINKTTH